jgi:hypothetical protein
LALDVPDVPLELDMSSAEDFKTVFVTVHVVGRTSYRINNSAKVWNR